MKNTILILSALLFCGAANAQWKAQTAETYDKTYRMAIVTSKSGGETLRVLRDVNAGAGKKSVNPYDYISGQILLNKNPGAQYTVNSIVFRFDESTKMYVHQSAAMSQGWDANAGRYIIESDWQIWRIVDTRNKGAVKSADAVGTDLRKEVMDLMKSGKTLSCQIILINKGDGSQSTIKTEFSLIGSTKSINYLIQ